MKNYKNEELKTFFTELLSYSKEEFMNLSDEEIADFLLKYIPLTREYISQASVEDNRNFFNQFLFFYI